MKPVSPGRRARKASTYPASNTCWRTIQQVFDAGYVDAFRARRPGETGFTFPSWQPHLRLDYVFAPAASVGRIVTCDVVHSDSATRASDHLPILAELSLVP